MANLLQIEPKDIESRSFAIIESEFLAQTSIDHRSLDPDAFQVIRRVIHATGDFSFARNLCFHREAVEKGVDSIRQGRNVSIDVTMGASGISRSILNTFGGEVICHINDPEITERARIEGRTRTETAIRKTRDENIGIYAVGNAPTALIALIDMLESDEIRPDLIVGVPVGFVNASESKELLMTKAIPFITVTGRKGGSPIAVAVINALLRIAQGKNYK